MSAKCSPPLPPLVVDPQTGKTFIAIPAPTFIASQVSDGTQHPSYIYVQSTSPVSHRMFTPERAAVRCFKPPVETWIESAKLSSAPPDHVPWTGQVMPVDSPGKPSDNVDFSFDRSSAELEGSTVNNWDSVSDIPTLSSGSTLLNGSLPSTVTYTTESDMSVPPFWKQMASSRKYTRGIHPTASAPSISAIRGHTSGSNSNTFVTVRKREAKYLQSGHPMDTRQIVQTSMAERKSTCLDSETLTDSSNTRFDNLAKMDVFLSDGLKEIDLNTQCLHRQKERLEAPSLVVSTSNAVIPLSLESSTDLKKASSLAQRRGKAAPGRLKLRMQRTEETLDYPEVPTAFRGTSSNETLVFPLPPAAVAVEGVKMTAEQMISSLRAQVNSLKLQYVKESSFHDQCGDAEGWLDTEVKLYREQEAWKRATKGIAGPTRMRPPTSHVTTRLRSATESVSKESSLFGRTVLGMTRFGYGLPKDYEKTEITTLPRSGMRRATISTSSESEKRVRFSVGPPIRIPYDILEKAADQAIGVETVVSQSSPPKRKPPPPLPAQLKNKGLGTSLPSPTLSTCTGSSRTTFNTNNSAMVSKPLRRRASDIVLPVMPVAAEENDIVMRISLDGHGSLRARPKIRMGDLLGSKRRTDENASYIVGLKEKSKTTKGKSRSRILPFQNVLNRLRG